MPVNSKPRAYRSELRSAAADETRARIVAAARTVLGSDKNPTPFSVEGVAREAGVTRLTIYNQFESKRGLLEAVFDDMAQQGGLMALQAVFAEADADTAMRRFVSVFCNFWAAHREVIPKFHAVLKLDEEITASLKQRTERRRQSLTVLVGRFLPDAGKATTDLIDVLFALTGFEMHEALATRNRSMKSVEALIQALVKETVNRFRSGTG